MVNFKDLTLSNNITNEELTAIYTDSYIKNAIKQDNTEFLPIKHHLVTYYKASIKDKFAGAFLSIAFSQSEIELHSLLFKDSIKYSRQLGKMIIDKSFNDNNKIQRITVLIIDGLNTAKNYCEKLGFKLEGIKRNSYLKNKEYKDVFIYGITKKDWSKS